MTPSSLEEQLLQNPSPQPRSSLRLKLLAAGVVAVLLAAAGVLAARHRYVVGLEDIGLNDLYGYDRDQFIQCTFHPYPGMPCFNRLSGTPPNNLELPRGGCWLGAPLRRLLLLSDGLSSPQAMEAFQRILQLAADARHESADKRVVVVLDAAYPTPPAASPYEFCMRRTQTLLDLGASAVTCVLLDPVARAHTGESALAEGGPKEAFGVAMHAMDDDYILRELSQAAAVWMEEGSPNFLLPSLRRRLNLSEQDRASQLTFEDVIRGRVLDGSGTFAYVGNSAGSMLAGDDVSFIYPGFNVTTLGLRLVHNCSFWPHAYWQDSDLLSNFSVTQHTGVTEIADCQPLVDLGEGEGLQYLGIVCP
ncbi:unnamed protein product [Polarella glacialis]|uniref:Uncharacterized protein n=1 Tax=Polarella glacialis TaxID=89957 RepID=A0A813KV49_POLGL|nr:unnamed protein product [Polarella glacialis]